MCGKHFLLMPVYEKNQTSKGSAAFAAEAYL